MNSIVENFDLLAQKQMCITSFYNNCYRRAKISQFSNFFL